MQYQIINNLLPSNRHLERIKTLLEQSKTVIIVSPFLMPDFKRFFEKIDLCSLEKIEIITTLPPNSVEQFPKINSLISLLETPGIMDGSIDCTISINNRLHGKIYIFKMPEGGTAAILTSANFTQKGLSYNHEWGVEISDPEIIANIEQSVRANLDYSIPDLESLYSCRDRLNEALEVNPYLIKPVIIDLDLTKYLQSEWSIKIGKSATYWLKPIGVTGDPVTPDWPPFDAPIYPLHFHWNPRSVKIGDIMVCYGIGAGKVLSIYRVISAPQQINPDEYDEEWMERWSWFVDGENLTPNYGSVWSNHELYLSSLRNDFLDKFPEKLITGNSQSLGALNYKKDKFRLSPEFAQFILTQVYSLNKS